VPFVTVGRTEFGDDHRWVDVDVGAGVREAVEHLIDSGHRRVGFVGGSAGSAVGDQGFEGYRVAIDAAGLLIRRGDVRRERDGVDAGRRLFQQRRPPTAIVTVSDPLAAGCLAAARDRGVVVGSDVAVIGFDDGPLASLLTPPLSSVRTPIEGMAREIVRILTATSAGGDASPAHVVLTPSLVVREGG
jgi:DNA-binding LacI/PurR family transcriptional regulator